MPKPGDVLVIRDFVFEDETKRDKWFVVLNSADIDHPCLALKTTSVNKRYHDCIKGCNKNHKCFYAPVSWQSCFEKDTFIQLPEIFEFQADVLLRNGLQKRIEYRPPLTQDCFNMLKSCLAGFKDDISQHHWNLI